LIPWTAKRTRAIVGATTAVIECDLDLVLVARLVIDLKLRLCSKLSGSNESRKNERDHSFHNSVF